MSYRAATPQNVRTVVDNFNFVIEIGAAHVECFLNTEQEVSIPTDDSRTVHCDPKRSRSRPATNTISKFICHYKGVRSSDNVTRLDGSAEWVGVAAGRLTNDQSTSAVAKRPACFQGILIMEDFDDNLDSGQKKLIKE
jgi:hypothetical protein